ncbi:hypothetical protein AK830_g65 [Neonectria ditissima]|uniref:Reverse transcriptase domain-containing protein n=1 Tax=Neonectria ditissima TaxID=78410 RepID=A0A0P7BQW8_9HYPO|nr:hypothetical protein AK830_g65 [Neonectria ditissima]
MKSEDPPVWGEFDLSESDLSESDLSAPDLSEPDFTEPDFTEPDFTEPDFTESDFPGVDLEEFENDAVCLGDEHTPPEAKGTELPDVRRVRILAGNLKQSPMRLKRLKTRLRTLQHKENHRPHVIAIQDPPEAIASSSIPGYRIWYSWLPLANTNNNDDSDKPKVSRVAFIVDAKVPLGDWQVEEPEEAPNKGLAASLRLRTASSTILAIHNVYNHLETIDIGHVLAMAGGPGDNILLGDFNLHHPDWSGDRTIRRTPAADQLACGINALGLELLTTPGVVTYSNSLDTDKRSSTIDLTFASQGISTQVEHCRVLDIPGFQSDHRLIETTLLLSLKQETKSRPFWKMVNEALFKHKLRSLLPPLDTPLDTREQVSRYIVNVAEALRETQALCVPTSSSRPPRQRAPTKPELELEEAVGKLDELQATYRATKDHRLLPELECLERDIQRLDTWCWRHFTETSANTMTGAFRLSNLAGKIGKPRDASHMPPLKYDGKYHSTDEDKVTAIRDSTFKNNADFGPVPEGPPPRPDDGRDSLFISRHVTSEEVSDLIKALPWSKACGTDKIPNEAIRMGGDTLLPFLVRIFNACFSMSYHPPEFKEAMLVMVRKQGKEANLPESWRPIALLSCMGKLMEKIVAIRMLRALQSEPHLLPATQFGCRSTTQAIQYLLEIVYSSWSDNIFNCVTILCTDMSNAYNILIRSMLLQSLSDKRMPPWIVDFILSFLSHRSGSFHLPGITSDTFELNTGIPQGSPLSPILFLIFAAPLLEKAPIGKRMVKLGETMYPCKLYSFAFVDDTYFIAVSKSYSVNCKALEALHRDVERIAEPLGIEFGTAKYHVMHFKRPMSRGKASTEIPHIPGFVEAPQQEVKILGVIVDSQLKWNEHLNTIKTKVEQRLIHLSRISGSTWGPTLHTMRQLYLTKIRPVFTYACGAWFIKRRSGEPKLRWGLTVKQISMLDRLHKKCLIRVSGAFHSTSAVVLEKELYIENLGTLLHSQACVQRAKVLVSKDLRWKDQFRQQPTKKAPKALPTAMLDQDAAVLIMSALGDLQERAWLTRECEDTVLQRWADDKKRGNILARWAKKVAALECKERWEAYVDDRVKRRTSQAKAGRPVKLPACLTEPWGKKSLKYYKNMVRQQSTILL